MSKKGLVKAMKHNHVIALPKVKQYKNGSAVKTLYDLYKID